MIYVINLVGPQLFITMSKYLEVLNAALLNADLNALATSSQLLSLLLSIFYSLNAVDLPEFFEDNIDNFMKIFVQILHINSEHESILNYSVLLSNASHSTQRNILLTTQNTFPASSTSFGQLPRKLLWRVNMMDWWPMCLSSFTPSFTRRGWENDSNRSWEVFSPFWSTPILSSMIMI